jgi:hypothetical protein
VYNDEAVKDNSLVCYVVPALQKWHYAALAVLLFAALSLLSH